MFESRTQPLASAGKFRRRMLRHILMAGGVVFGALAIGTSGYHYIARFAWPDAFLNASMILSGMGPVGDLPTDGAKIFAAAYALFSGLMFISIMGILLAPAAHRALHAFHLDEQDDDSNSPASS
jgi:hypothetical protein